MKASEKCSFPVEVYNDELTGRPVRRIGAENWRTHHQYFYLRMWTGDSQRLLISSNRQDGIYRHYLVDVADGAATCLTNCKDLSAFFGELSADGETLMYVAGRHLRILNLADMTERTVYTKQDPWTGGSVYYGATGDSGRAVMVEMHKDDRVAAKEGWDAFPLQFAAHPRCRLVELDVQTGQSKVIHQGNCWLGHPNYRPNGKTIMFCHEGPWEQVISRIWFIDPDGSNLRQGRLRARDRPAGEGSGELWGHEYWLADSSRAAYIYFPGEYGVDATIRMLDPDSLAEQVLMEVSSYSHFISNHDGRLIVADGEARLSDAIYLIDVAAKSESILVKHGSSMKPYIDGLTGLPSTQEVHPHPCFSPDSKQVAFTSDKDGFPAVYVTDI